MKPLSLSLLYLFVMHYITVGVMKDKMVIAYAAVILSLGFVIALWRKE